MSSGREAATDPTPGAPAPAAAVPPVPAVVWAAAAVALLLRAVPFAALLLATPPPGAVAVPAAFVPKDWLAYAALIRQGPGPFANPFTTEPQGARIVLLLHQALGAVHAATGLDPFWLLELARVPALLAFTWVLWRFVARVHAAGRVRVWACLLVLLSGGVAFAARAAAPWLPEAARQAVQRNLWTAYGWSTFDASFNPVWLAGLTLALAALAPLVQPGGPASARERVTAAVALAATFLVHPYSAVAAGAAVAGTLASTWLSRERWRAAQLRRCAAALAPAAAALGALVLWQRADPAFRAASGGFFGRQGVSVLWYPLTLGALGALALAGLRGLAARRDPWRHGLVGWIGAVAVLHSSSLVNGYHFLFALHLPVAILAAPALAAWLERRRGAGARGALAAGAVLALLFATPLATTAADVREPSWIDVEVERLLVALGEAPPGNVLAPAQVSRLVPAYGRHRVFAGHWFMTPDYAARAELADAVTGDPGRAADLRALVAAQAIDHLVVAPAVLPALAAAGVPVARVTDFGPLVLVAVARR